MRPSKQSLRPDTCGCIVHQWWDKDTALEDRVVYIDYFEFICPAHDRQLFGHPNLTPTMEAVRERDSLTDSEAFAWGCIWEDDDSEQKRKNGTQRELMENHELGLNRIVVDDEGRPSHDLKAGYQYRWRFLEGTGKRTLEVYIERPVENLETALAALSVMRELPRTLEIVEAALSVPAKAKLEVFLETRWPGGLVVVGEKPFGEGG